MNRRPFRRASTPRLARIFHHICGSRFGAEVTAGNREFGSNRARGEKLFDSGTHAPLPPLFRRAGDSTSARYPVLKALATCAKIA